MPNVLHGIIKAAQRQHGHRAGQVLVQAIGRCPLQHGLPQMASCLSTSFVRALCPAKKLALWGPWEGLQERSEGHLQLREA
eukprot:1090562-Lingulodinium_polyedra.AAC.1